MKFCHSRLIKTYKYLILSKISFLLTKNTVIDLEAQLQLLYLIVLKYGDVFAHIVSINYFFYKRTEFLGLLFT